MDHHAHVLVLNARDETFVGARLILVLCQNDGTDAAGDDRDSRTEEEPRFFSIRSPQTNRLVRAHQGARGIQECGQAGDLQSVEVLHLAPLQQWHRRAGRINTEELQSEWLRRRETEFSRPVHVKLPHVYFEHHFPGWPVKRLNELLGHIDLMAARSE